jgi:hypothetical protein
MEGVVDDVAAAFFEGEGEAEEVFLGHLFFPAEGLECFDGAHDFLGCGVEFESHRWLHELHGYMSYMVTWADAE